MFLLNFKKYRFIYYLIVIIVVFTAILSNVDWVLKIVFPIHYKEYIYQYADEYDLDPYLVVAIIRVESRFFEEAISSKNARGLMQIAPITGNWASEELEITDYTEELLFDPKVNIKIGCWYLNVLRKEFDGNLRNMLAAYNGGSGNVHKWLLDDRYSEDGKTLKDIPFNETKNYVDKVLKFYKVYKVIYQ